MDDNCFLTEDESEKLILNALISGQVYTEDDLAEILSWANRTVAFFAIFKEILRGTIRIAYENDSIMFYPMVPEDKQELLKQFLALEISNMQQGD